MSRIVAGATGLIGKCLVAHWLKAHHDVTIISRYPQQARELFGSHVKAISWDDLSLDLFLTAEVVVNLAGASIADKRWSEARKQEIIASRVKTTQKIAEYLAQIGPASPPLLNASAIGTYGLQQQQSEYLPDRLTEETWIDKEHAPDFLSFVGRSWEKATELAAQEGVRVLLLRFGIVLAKTGGALPKIIQPFNLWLGGPMGSGQQAFSWVALEDVIRAIDFLLSERNISGPFNIVAPNCISQRELAMAIGKVLKKPSCVPMPAIVLEMMLGKQMAKELLLEGQHVYPQRLLALGFQFQYPDITSALNFILRS